MNEKLYKYIVMLFGLCNALETLKRLINLVLFNILNEFFSIIWMTFRSTLIPKRAT